MKSNIKNLVKNLNYGPTTSHYTQLHFKPSLLHVFVLLLDCALH